jgi:hypothetical protein
MVFPGPEEEKNCLTCSDKQILVKRVVLLILSGKWSLRNVMFLLDRMKKIKVFATWAHKGITVFV